MHSYRYPPRLAAIYAALLIVLLGLGFYNGEGDPQYTAVWMIVLSPFLLFALCRLLITLLRRVEVGDDYIRYRGLLGSKTFEFSPEMELYVARGLFRCLLVCRLHWTVIRLRDDDGNPCASPCTGRRQKKSSKPLKPTKSAMRCPPCSAPSPPMKKSPSAGLRPARTKSAKKTK